MNTQSIASAKHDPRAINLPPAVLAIDIGGTKIAAALVDDQGSIVAKFPDVPTPCGGEAIENVIAGLLARAAGERSCVHVGISIAGFVSADASTVVLAPNLGLRDYPMGDRLNRRLGLPVWVENDVNAAAWGEHRFGAGQNAAVMVVVMIGTGLGGGIVVNGALLRGEHGFAAELGHLRHAPNGRACGCGNDGCWEQYVSSHAFDHHALGAGTDLAGTHVPHDTALAALGDELGLGLADLVMLLDPSVIVLSGGISKSFARFEKAMYDSLRSRLVGSRPLPRVVASELGADAALRGVADQCVQVGVPA